MDCLYVGLVHGRRWRGVRGDGKGELEMVGAYSSPLPSSLFSPLHPQSHSLPPSPLFSLHPSLLIPSLRPSLHSHFQKYYFYRN